MRRRCSPPASPQGTPPLGLTGVVLCALSLGALAGGCLNPRPEELPSSTIVVIPNADEPSNGNAAPEIPRGPEPLPGEAGAGDFGVDDGDYGEPTGTGDADAGAPADAGLRALDSSADVDPAAPAGDESPADESAAGQSAPGDEPE